jgi:hypothetical protein
MALLALITTFCMVFEVRRHVAGWELTTHVGPVPDPAVLALAPVVQEEHREALRPPSLMEIQQFFSQPNLTWQHGAYWSTRFIVSLREDLNVVEVITRDAERERTELSLELVLDGLRRVRRNNLEEAVWNAQLGLSHERTRIESLQLETGDEYPEQVTAIDAALGALESFLDNSNGGLSIEIEDVGSSRWETSATRAILALLAGATIIVSLVALTAATDRRLRSRSELAVAAPRAEFIGLVGYSDNPDYVQQCSALSSRLLKWGGASNRLIVVGLGHLEETRHCIDQLLADDDLQKAWPQVEIQHGGTIPEGNSATAEAPTTVVLVIPWGVLRDGDLTRTATLFSNLGTDRITTILHAVPARELAPAVL